MFAELVKKEAATVRGKKFVFHEIGSVDWVNYVMTDDDPSQQRSQVEIAQANHDYVVRVVAASVAPGVEQTIEQLIDELHPLPGDLVDELFIVAERVNGLREKFEALQGKGRPADDMPDD